MRQERVAPASFQNTARVSCAVSGTGKEDHTRNHRRMDKQSAHISARFFLLSLRLTRQPGDSLQGNLVARHLSI
jgi:hypothetical protein